MARDRFRLLWLLLLALAVVAIAFSPERASPTEPAVDERAAVEAATPAPAVVIEIVDFSFEPMRVEIGAGETVRWKNLDASPHSVISDDAEIAFDSGRLDRGAGFRLVFTEPGVYDYECGYHQNMAGVVVVRSAGDALPQGGEPRSPAQGTFDG